MNALIVLGIVATLMFIVGAAVEARGRWEDRHLHDAARRNRERWNR